jgi:hypothetical protein
MTRAAVMHLKSEVKMDFTKKTKKERTEQYIIWPNMDRHNG